MSRVPHRSSSCSRYQQSSQSCSARNLGSARKGPAWEKHPVFRQRDGGVQTKVVRGGLQVALGWVVGLGDRDEVYATVGGKLVDRNSTLTSGGITPDCTVYLHLCINTLGFAEGPVKMSLDSGCARVATLLPCAYTLCGEPRTDTPAPWLGEGKGRSNKGPLGRDPPAAPMCRPR